MTNFTPGERVLVDRSLPARFVRYAGAAAVISVGVDTRVVDPVVLSKSEG